MGNSNLLGIQGTIALLAFALAIIFVLLIFSQLEETTDNEQTKESLSGFRVALLILLVGGLLASTIAGFIVLVKFFSRID